MSITHFPHGIQATPNLGGSSRFAGWWGKSYFVDYDHGGAEMDGLSPDSPLSKLQTAIDLATTNDVIYIRNRDQDITSTDPEAIIPASTTNWSIAEAQTHLSIIGASNVSHIPTMEGQYGVYLKGHATANTTAVMDWRGAFGLIENLAFHSGGSTAGGHLALTGNSTSLRALGTVVSNCLFRMSTQAAHGAVHNVDNWFITVYGCTFHDCLFGVRMAGSASTLRRITVANCLFRNQTAASVNTNIRMAGTSGQNILIDGCTFTTPVGTAGDAKMIYIVDAMTGTICNCNFPIDTTEGTTGITDNGLSQVNNHQAMWTADDGNGGLVV